MPARAIDRNQVELVAAARAGVPLPALLERFEVDEAQLQKLNEAFESVPDEIVLGIKRILSDNIGLKKIIADLVARSVHARELPGRPGGA